MSDWINPDDAPLLTPEVFARMAIWHGDKLIRPATGTYTKDWSKTGRPPVGDAPKEPSACASTAKSSRTSAARGRGGRRE